MEGKLFFIMDLIPHSMALIFVERLNKLKPTVALKLASAAYKVNAGKGLQAIWVC